MFNYCTFVLLKWVGIVAVYTQYGWRAALAMFCLFTYLNLSIKGTKLNCTGRCDNAKS